MDDARARTGANDRRGKRGRALTIGLAAVVGLAVYGGAAMAMHDVNTLHACAKENSGDLRLVADAQECKPSEAAVEWNVQGPTGPPGTASVHAHIAEETSDAPFFGVTAWCEEGEVALGGGFDMRGSALASAQVRRDQPVSDLFPDAGIKEGEVPNGWRAFLNKGSGDLTLEVFVLCADGA